MEYLESTMWALVFDILICWKGLGYNDKQILLLYCNSHVYCYGRKKHAVNVKIYDTQHNVQECVIFKYFAKKIIPATISLSMITAWI